MKAIILAAGKGTRLLPMTLIKPKPLLEVNGKTLFENMIEFLHLSGINDITVVTGYKHEAFDKYVEKLNLKKVVNENYDATNSSSSLKLVLDEINDDTLIINGDLYIKNDFVKSINREVSQFIGQYLDETVNTTWVYHVDDNNRLIDVDVNAKGGGLCETCIAYFAKNDIEFFKKEFMKNDDNEHWDNCIIRIMKEKDFYVTEVHDSIYEIDSFSDAISHNLITYDNIAEQCSDNNKAVKISDYNVYNIDFLGDKKIIKLYNDIKLFNNNLSERNIVSIIPYNLYPKTETFDFNIKIIDYLN
ncbi:sugar phosphate nucleotidyltransferase, partial [Brachyspira hyodysenteriae]|uniref:sugar phosphate nucleotidyltransferase n=1 Tax=Brachyspira hyodysenteriae TaxID=159 RepID=UPI0015C47936